MKLIKNRFKLNCLFTVPANIGTAFLLSAFLKHLPLSIKIAGLTLGGLSGICLGMILTTRFAFERL